MAKISGNELLVKALEAQGAEKIFSIPGGQLLGVYEEIRRSNQLDLVVPRQEGASALLACGYSLSKAKPGVVISTVGAGVIYELAGLIYAWLERIPLISIAPQVQSWRIKPIQENLQALNQDELYAPITKFHTIIYHPERIPQLLSRAYKIALAPEPGPVHLDLPLDILFQTKSLNQSQLQKMIPKAEKTRFTGKQSPDPKELEKALSLIQEAKKPLAFLGRMLLRSPECLKALADFLSRAKIPALSSTPAFSVLEGKNKYSLGTLDLYDSEPILELLKSADLFLYLEPDEEVIQFHKKISNLFPPPPAIQLSSSPLLFHSFAHISSALAGTPELILELLAKELEPKPSAPEKTQWLEKLSQERLKALQQASSTLALSWQREYQQVFELVSQILKPEDFLVCEGKEILLGAKIFLKNYYAGKVIFIPENVPAGTGFPLALGIKAGAERARVLLLTDRRNFKYHSRELQTQARYQLGICSLVFPSQEPLAETEPDLAHLAQSFGLKGLSLREPLEELNEKLLGEALELAGGALMEIRGF